MPKAGSSKRPTKGQMRRWSQAEREKKIRRRRIERAFLKWFTVNQKRFAIEIKLDRRTDRNLVLSFVGINGAVSAALTTWEINVYADYEDYCWDMIISIDAWPRRVTGGYVCTSRLPEWRTVFPDLLSLYADYVFEPFLKWVNEKLAKANWLVLEGTREKGITWAKLKHDLREGGEGFKEDAILIPLRDEAT